MDEETKLKIFECPHCGGFVEIVQLNCGIFRHAYDANFNQINPHASVEECVKNTVHGCGKPFRIVNGKAVVCDYI